MPPALRQLEMVWAYVRGSPYWPGIIEAELPDGKYKIHFFGDYTTCNVNKSKIKHFLEGFNDYSKMKKPTNLLIKAVEESKIFLFEAQKPHRCYICQMLDLRKTYLQNRQL